MSLRGKLKSGRDWSARLCGSSTVESTDEKNFFPSGIYPFMDENRHLRQQLKESLCLVFPTTKSGHFNLLSWSQCSLKSDQLGVQFSLNIMRDRMSQCAAARALLLRYHTAHCSSRGCSITWMIHLDQKHYKTGQMESSASSALIFLCDK